MQTKQSNRSVTATLNSYRRVKRERERENNFYSKVKQKDENEDLQTKNKHTKMLEEMKECEPSVEIIVEREQKIGNKWNNNGCCIFTIIKTNNGEYDRLVQASEEEKVRDLKQ